MPAYVVALIQVDDPHLYRRYAEATPPIVARHRGRFLARGGEVAVLEGEPYPDRLVILEFPATPQAQAWFADPEYQAVAELRRAASNTRFLLIDGLPA